MEAAAKESAWILVGFFWAMADNDDAVIHQRKKKLGYHENEILKSSVPWKEMIAKQKLTEFQNLCLVRWVWFGLVDYQELVNKKKGVEGVLRICFVYSNIFVVGALLLPIGWC